MAFLLFREGVLALLIVLTEVGNILTLGVFAEHKFLFIPVADVLAGIGVGTKLVQMHGIWCVGYLGGTLYCCWALLSCHMCILLPWPYRDFLPLSFQ